MKLVRYQDEHVTNKYELNIDDVLALLIERLINDRRGAGQPALRITVKMLEDVINGDFIHDGTHNEPYEWEQEIILSYIGRRPGEYYTENLSELIGEYITDYIYENFVGTRASEFYEYEDEVVD